MPRGKAPPCPNCRNKFNRPYKMHRIYVKMGGKFKLAGWICPRCKHALIE